MKRLVVLAFALVGCASTELELPDDHPANARAKSQPVATSEVLREGFDPFANEPAPAEDPHQHHHHHGKGAEK